MHEVGKFLLFTGADNILKSAAEEPRPRPPAKMWSSSSLCSTSVLPFAGTSSAHVLIWQQNSKARSSPLECRRAVWKFDQSRKNRAQLRADRSRSARRRRPSEPRGRLFGIVTCTLARSKMKDEVARKAPVTGRGWLPCSRTAMHGNIDHDRWTHISWWHLMSTSPRSRSSCSTSIRSTSFEVL